MTRQRPAVSHIVRTARTASSAGPVWFFDLDDTLHDAGHRIYDAISGRMTQYVADHVGLDHAAASALRIHYWRRYGATLLGLQRHHAVDTADFLRRTHDFDVPGLLQAEAGLVRRLARLPGRKVLLTNAPLDYAGRVLDGIGLHRLLRHRYAIEHMRVHGTLRPKPSAALLRHVLAREGLNSRAAARRAVLVEDNVANLKTAHALGLRTVLIDRHCRQVKPGRRLYVDHRISSLTALRRLRFTATG